MSIRGDVMCRKARKQRECLECGGKIQVGEIYAIQTHTGGTRYGGHYKAAPDNYYHHDCYFPVAAGYHGCDKDLDRNKESGFPIGNIDKAYWGHIYYTRSSNKWLSPREWLAANKIVINVEPDYETDYEEDPNAYIAIHGVYPDGWAGGYYDNKE